MAVNCAILSYNGAVYFGFSGDTHAAPDLRQLEKFLQQSFGELRDALQIELPHKKKTVARRRVAPPPIPNNTTAGTAPISMPRPVWRAGPEPPAPGQPEKHATELVVA